jgi:UDP-N-acetylglucosamine diphosphorylase / glucose-1-phosphate thymidylyltransferase / UDP-N-acetylgalactosamine diphosphorylase / glucosamine-1-phosphate N-acetyltransferase / galactosamine-1-phosphate N-acetyltransferase
MKFDSYLLLTLGGIGKRFKDAKVCQPKFLLDFKNKPVIENILKSYDGNFLLIVGVNNIYRDYKKLIENCINNIGIKHYLVVFIESTNSQSESAFKTLIKIENKKKIQPNTPLFIINGDTITNKKNLDSISKKMKKNDLQGFIEYFNSNSKNFSYISIDENSNVMKIEEKEVISNYATTGFYGFRNFCSYNQAYKKAMVEFKDNKKKEMYISFLYKKMIEDGQKIGSFSVKKDPIILGTPEEYFYALSLL